MMSSERLLLSIILGNFGISLYKLPISLTRYLYGIGAGRLAGLPTSAIDRARQVMGQIEKHSKIALGLRKGIQQTQSKKDSSGKAIAQLDIYKD